MSLLPLLEELLDGLLGFLTLGGLLEGVDGENGLQSLQLQSVAINDIRQRKPYTHTWSENMWKQETGPYPAQHGLARNVYTNIAKCSLFSIMQFPYRVGIKCL